MTKNNNLILNLIGSFFSVILIFSQNLNACPKIEGEFKCTDGTTLTASTASINQKPIFSTSRNFTDLPSTLVVNNEEQPFYHANCSGSISTKYCKNESYRARCEKNMVTADYSYDFMNWDLSETKYEVFGNLSIISDSINKITIKHEAKWDDLKSASNRSKTLSERTTCVRI